MRLVYPYSSAKIGGFASDTTYRVRYGGNDVYSPAEASALVSRSRLRACLGVQEECFIRRVGHAYLEGLVVRHRRTRPQRRAR